MDIFLIIVACIFLLVGFVGCLLPVVPGIPLSYIGILLLHLSSKIEFSSEFLIGWGLVVIVIQVLDYIIPVWGIKRFGGSKLGVRGSIAGMFIGMFLGPLGIIFGPFAGAIVGELLTGKSGKAALRAGFGTFLGLLIGTILKLTVAGFMFYYYIQAVVSL